MLLRAICRHFSKLQEIEQYSLKKHLRNYLEKQKLLVSGQSPSDFVNKELEEASYMQRPLDKTFYPSQHPEKLDYPDHGIISYKPKTRNLAPFYHLPKEAVVFEEEDYVSPPDSKSLDICILGPPNAGKSALLNALVGKTVTAVSPKYNTTNDKILGVYTDEREKVQLCLYDTPGAIKVKNNPNSKILVTQAWETINECDKVLFVVDCVKHMNSTLKDAVKRLRNTYRSAAEQRYMDKIKATRDSKSLPTLNQLNKELAELDQLEDEDNPPQISSLLLLNKVDLATNKAKMRALQRELEDLGQFEKTLFISAKTGYGLEELTNYLVSEAKTRPWEYNPKTKSTQCEAEKAGEVMRQEIYKKFYYDIPYNIDIKIASWVPRSNGELVIDYQLDVERKVHVGILLGKKGRIMEEVKTECTTELCKLLSRPVKINVSVVVNPSLRKA